MSRIGRYELLHLLGRGASAEVWEAELRGPQGFRRPVALKVLRAGPDEPRAVDAFLQEARIGGLVHHPNVVVTCDLGREEGRWYVAMEVVRGCSVADLVDEGIPPEVALEIGVQVCAGLQHVHELEIDGRPAGVVHRDVKPSNLLVDRTGLVKLADLGIATATGGRGIAGTPGYMAPEQWAGAAVDARADLYGLGTTLAELVTGAREPTSTSTLPEASEAWERSGPDPRLDGLDDAVPGLAAVLARCLCDDPADRWPSAAALGAELERLRAGLPGTDTLADRMARRYPVADEPVPWAPAGEVPPVPDVTVGRRGEIGEILDGLAAGVRWVTLTGRGGVGKSRVAWEVANRAGTLARRADLEPATTFEEACFAIGRALDIQPGRGDPVTELERALGGLGRALLWLDAVDRVGSPLRPVLERWLAAAPGLCVLCTSREALGSPRERELRLEPLDSETSAELFVTRVGRPLGDVERSAARAVAGALDGLPLTIELFAARARTEPLPALAEQVSHQLARVVAADLAAARASVDTAGDLLSPLARAALGQLSVFEGGFRSDAAEAVLALGSSRWAVSVLEELAAVGMVRVDAAGARYEVLRPVREYAADRLPPEARAGAERRHGAHYACLGDRHALAALWGPAARERWRALLAEVPNLLRATERAVDRRDGSVAARCARPVATALQHRGPLPALVDLLERVLPIAPPEHRLRLLQDSATALQRSGRTGEARRRFEEVRVASSAAGDAELEVSAASALGNVAMEQGDPVVAEEWFASAASLAGRHALRRLQGVVWSNWANVQHLLDRHEEAASAFARSLALLQAVGDRWSEAIVRGNRANLLMDTGRLDEAAAELEQALRDLRSVGNRRSEAVCVGNLGNLHLRRGDAERARACYERGVATCRAIGDPRATARTLANIANLDRRERRFDDGRARYAEALDLARDAGDGSTEALIRRGIGDLELDAGRPDRAIPPLVTALAAYEAQDDALQVAVTCAQLGLCWCAIGALRAAEGQIEEARTALARAEAFGVRIGVAADTDLDRALVALRASIAPAAR